MDGVIIKSTGSWYSVRLQDGKEVKARLPGRFKLESKKISNPIAVGDKVELLPEAENFIIEVITPRKNYIVRKSPKKKHFAHMIAANIDQAVLIASHKRPRTSLGFIDRFLVTLEAFRIPGYLLINKSDLYSKEEQTALRGIMELYESIGYQTMMTSFIEGVPHQVGDWLQAKTTLLSGHSGSGKSTLIRHLNRLIEPTDGEILVDGVDIMKLSTTELRQMRQNKMSMVFQKFALLPHRTVLQNAAIALDIQGVDKATQDQEAQKWLNRVGLGGYENHYPSQLSGGMQQRVGIARALTSNSDIMLMDEAFSALDPLIRTDMQDLLLELQVELKKTIVFITHDLDEALKLADHLVILKDGAVIQQGEPQGILMAPADPYIEDFVSDINRARVLRIGSVMQELTSLWFTADVDANDNLESLIATSGGDTSLRYRVIENGEPVGELDMRELVKALVPRISSSEAGTRYH